MRIAVSMSVIVMESDAQDENRNLVRIDPLVMNELELHDGDLVAIKGELQTKNLMCLALLPHDTNKGIIRLDLESRRTIGAKIGQKVTVALVNTSNYSKAESDGAPGSEHSDNAELINEPRLLISGCCIDFDKERDKIMEYLASLEMELHVTNVCKCYSEGKKTLGWDFFIVSIPLQMLEKLAEIHPEIDKKEGVTLEQRFVLWLSGRMKSRKLDYHLKLSEIPFQSVGGFRLNPKNYHDPNEMNNLK
jgi:Cell division protein 48 (CDC48), N-terminal domain